MNDEPPEQSAGAGMASHAVTPSRRLTDADKVRRLPWWIGFQASNSIFCALTIFGSVFVLFLDALGLPKDRIGILLSIACFCTMLAPLLLPLAERFGYKRTSMAVWAARTVIILGLPLTPWVVRRYGLSPGFWYISTVILLFGISRAIGEVAFYRWSQWLIPHGMRGRVVAVSSMLINAGAAGALFLAGWYIGDGADISRFLWIFGVGAVFGLVSVLCLAYVPEQAPVPARVSGTGRFLRILSALRDGNFIFFLLAIGVARLGMATNAFIPLYLKYQIGLTTGRVVTLGLATLLASLASSFALGSLADRRGGRRVQTMGTCLLIIVPALYYLLPRNSGWYWAAMALSFLNGLGFTALGIGNDRQLFVEIMPKAREYSYIPVISAWMGITMGGGPLLAGWVLRLSAHVSGKVWGLPVGPYTTMLVMAIGCYILSAWLLTRMSRRRDAAPPTPLETHPAQC